MRRSFLITAGIVLTACSAIAANYTPPGTSLENVQSGTYNLDTSHANIIFGINHMGFSNYYGRFNTIDGSLNFDAKSPEKSSVKITVDVGSIDTNNAKLQGELKGDQWFDTAKFPTATFTSTKLEKLTATTGKLYGDLTLHGVTKPIVLDVTLNGAGQNVMMAVPELGFGATAVIKRSDFGVSQYIPMVGDEVTLMIQAEFHGAKQ